MLPQLTFRHLHLRTALRAAPACTVAPPLSRACCLVLPHRLPGCAQHTTYAHTFTTVLPDCYTTAPFSLRFHVDYTTVGLRLHTTRTRYPALPLPTDTTARLPATALRFTPFTDVLCSSRVCRSFPAGFVRLIVRLPLLPVVCLTFCCTVWIRLVCYGLLPQYDSFWIFVGCTFYRLRSILRLPVTLFWTSFPFGFTTRLPGSCHDFLPTHTIRLLDTTTCRTHTTLPPRSPYLPWALTVRICYPCLRSYTLYTFTLYL